MLKQFVIRDSKIVETSGNDGSIYLYINPDEGERRYLVEGLGIDEHTLESSLDPYELARMEVKPDQIALIVKRPKRYTAKDNFLFRIESIGMFIFNGGLATGQPSRLIIVLGEDIPLFEGRLFARVDSIQDTILKLICQSILHFEEHLKIINICSEELECEVSTSLTNRQLLSMFTLEKSLVYYLNAISSNGRVIDKLRSSAAKLALSPAHLELVDDLAIENAQCYEMANIYSQVIASLMDARASLINNNLNILMKNLNAIAIAVAVPSLIAGVGGMSEFSAMIGSDNLKMGYAAFAAVMVLLGVVTFFAVRASERFWRGL